MHFAGAGDKGLIICTWPRGGRPDHVMLYSDEVWTGIEYQVAAHMIYEGMVEEGLAIIKGARDRYDGINRPPVPRNPWNEIECGGHYARAMSSWSILLALSGYEYDGPSASCGLHPAQSGAVQGILLRSRRVGKPPANTRRQRPAEHRLCGRRTDCSLPASPGCTEPPITARVTLGDASLNASLQNEGGQVRIIMATPQVVRAGNALSVVLA